MNMNDFLGEVVEVSDKKEPLDTIDTDFEFKESKWGLTQKIVMFIMYGNKRTIKRSNHCLI